MPVVEVEHGSRILPNRVFIAPPCSEVRLEGELFHVAPLPQRRGWPTTISTFLLAFAENAGRHAVAVILS
jgi:chemotaxis response regulator CheB